MDCIKVSRTSFRPSQEWAGESLTDRITRRHWIQGHTKRDNSSVLVRLQGCVVCSKREGEEDNSRKATCQMKETLSRRFLRSRRGDNMSYIESRRLTRMKLRSVSKKPCNLIPIVLGVCCRFPRTEVCWCDSFDRCIVYRSISYVPKCFAVSCPVNLALRWCL